MAIKRFLLGMAVGALAANLYANSSRSRMGADDDTPIGTNDMSGSDADDVLDDAYSTGADLSSVSMQGRTDDLLEPGSSSLPASAREPSTTF